MSTTSLGLATSGHLTGATLGTTPILSEELSGQITTVGAVTGSLSAVPALSGSISPRALSGSIGLLRLSGTLQTVQSMTGIID